MNKLIPNKVYSLLVITLSSYIFLHLFQYNSNRSVRGSLLNSFNHTFSTTFPKSTTWITSSPRKEPKPIEYNPKPDEKYLTFFTHSGFQNQLIQVENGILLAWYLNRTLILPKALLGEPFGWSQFSKLYLHHILRDTSNPYCKRFKDKKSRKLASCPDPKKYALASFDDLFDLSWAKRHVKIVQRESSDFDWLESNFGIQRGLQIDNKSHGTYVDGDVLFFKDETRYDWRIYDVPTRYKYLGRYAGSLDVAELQNRTEKLIHFTSLFGTGKFLMKNPENVKFFEKLKSSITYKHPAVLKITEIVIDALGGSGNFLGAHLRTADGLFVDAIPENIESILEKIENITAKSIESTKIQHLLTNKNISSLLSTCVTLAKSKQTTLVFLATDAINPRNDDKFKQLWQHSPCTFTLNDILPNNSPLWSHMDQFRATHTGDSLRRFLIPLVDALVASKGNSFIGTKGSTFSGYIRRLHQTHLASKS